MSHIRLQVLESRTPWEIKWEEAKRLTKYSSFCQKKGDFQEAFLALDQAVTLNHSGIIMNIRKRKNKNLSDSTMLKMRKNLVLLSQRNNLQEMLESSQTPDFNQEDEDLKSIIESPRYRWGMAKMKETNICVQERLTIMKKSLGHHIFRQDPSNSVKWSDFVGLDNVKEALEGALLGPIMFHDQPGRKDVSGILLFGPPGTGKSYLAQAVASNFGWNFISVRGSDLMARCHGQTEQNVRLLFEFASTQKPAIVFFDDLEALFQKRSDADDRGRSTVTELLLATQKNPGVLIMGATSLPWLMDEAFIRRFSIRCYIPLPNVTHRYLLLKKELQETNHLLLDVDFKLLARNTEGFSPSDIVDYLRVVDQVPCRDLLAADYFVNDFKTNKIYPATEEDVGSTQMSALDYLGEFIYPPLDLHDFLTHPHKKSTTMSMLQKHEVFYHQFGTIRGKTLAKRQKCLQSKPSKMEKEYPVVAYKKASIMSFQNLGQGMESEDLLKFYQDKMQVELNIAHMDNFKDLMVQGGPRGYSQTYKNAMMCDPYTLVGEDMDQEMKKKKLGKTMEKMFFNFANLI